MKHLLMRMRTSVTHQPRVETLVLVFRVWVMDGPGRVGSGWTHEIYTTTNVVQRPTCVNKTLQNLDVESELVGENRICTVSCNPVQYSLCGFDWACPVPTRCTMRNQWDPQHRIYIRTGSACSCSAQRTFTRSFCRVKHPNHTSLSHQYEK